MSKIALALLAFGCAAAHDLSAAPKVTIMQPALFDYKNAPLTPPRFMALPKPQSLRSVAGGKNCAYVLVTARVNENGTIEAPRNFATQDGILPLLPADASAIKFNPAMHDGKPAPSRIYYAIIYNPADQSPNARNAAPRILAVAPVLLPAKVAQNLATNLVRAPIWIVASIDATGALTDYTIEQSNAYAETFKTSIGDALKKWRFAPAREDNRPGAGTLRVPLLIASIPPATPKAKATNPGQAKGNATNSVGPKIIEPRVHPMYPSSMKRSGIVGEVTVQFTVDEKGKVKDPVVTRTNGEAFNQPAIDAVLKWKFKPGTVDGKPVSTRMLIPMTFNLNADDNRRAKETYTVQTPSVRAQAEWPEELRYDTAPRVTNVVAPAYPYELLAKKTKGTASVLLHLDEKGRVVATRVMESSHPEFGESARAAACHHEFTPAMNKGHPTSTALKMEFVFDRLGKTVSAEGIRLLALEEKKSDIIVPSAKLDAPPKPVYRAAPKFPPQLNGIVDKGEANVEFLLDAKGIVQLPRVVSASDPAFGYAAVQAVSAWRFSPALVAGKPVITRLRVPVEFSLKGDSQQPAPQK